MEMEFLNGLYEKYKKYSLYNVINNATKIKWEKWYSKWLEAVGVFLDSIGKYLAIPFLDIILEVVRIASIFLKQEKIEKLNFGG